MFLGSCVKFSRYLVPSSDGGLFDIQYRQDWVEREVLEESFSGFEVEQREWLDALQTKVHDRMQDGQQDDVMADQRCVGSCLHHGQLHHRLLPGRCSSFVVPQVLGLEDGLLLTIIIRLRNQLTFIIHIDRVGWNVKLTSATRLSS